MHAYLGFILALRSGQERPFVVLPILRNAESSVIFAQNVRKYAHVALPGYGDLQDCGSPYWLYMDPDPGFPEKFGPKFLGSECRLFWQKIILNPENFFCHFKISSDIKKLLFLS